MGGLMDWMILPLKRYAEFEGRSRRMEFWMFQLLNLIVSGIAIAIMSAGGFDLIAMSTGEFTGSAEIGGMFYLGAGLLGLWGLAVLVPSIALTVRRLHDRNMSGWWYLGILVASLIPFVGLFASLAYLVLMLLPGTDGPNRFGPDPKAGGDAAVFD